MAVRFYCDKCGKEVDPNYLADKSKCAECNMKVYMYEPGENDMITGINFEAFLCEDCFKGTMLYLKNKYNNESLKYNNKHSRDLYEGLEDKKFKHSNLM